MRDPGANMTDSPPILGGNPSKPCTREKLLIVADACFEMFSIKELRNPLRILPELSTEFPDLSKEEILEAIRLALSWRRLLRAAGKPVH
jgi:hypothetical protein